jgi:hypothetical protein
MRGTRTSIRKLVHQHSVRVVALNFRVARSIEAIEELTRKTLFCWLLPITSPMTMHNPSAEDLTLYVLESLSGEDRLALEIHLEKCSVCKNEVHKLRQELSALTHSGNGPDPPSSCRERLLAAIVKRQNSFPGKKGDG